jgi:DNA-binding MarR family transcriptional regulator
VTGRAGHPDVVAASSLVARLDAPGDIVELLRRLMRAALGLFADCARSAGLNQTDYLALLRLVGADGMSPLELRQILGLGSSSVVEVADRLESRKLIARTRPLEDRRRVILRPTIRGKGVIQQTLGPALARLEAIGSELSEQDHAAVDRFLRKLAGAIAETAPAPPTGRTLGRSPRPLA